MKKAIVAPIILAIKSIQSPLLLPFVQYACSISIKPPIATGINHTQIICPNFMSLWHFIYSNKIIEHVPPYIMICVHLSARATLSSGVCGGVQKQSIHIMMIHKHDNGYLCVILLLYFIFMSLFNAKLG